MNPFLLIRRLLEWLGFWKDKNSPKVQIAQLEENIKEYNKAKTANEDKLKDFENEIKKLEAELKKKVQDYLAESETSKLRVLKEKQVVRQKKILETTFDLNKLYFDTLDTYDSLIVKTRALIMSIEQNKPDIQTLTFDLRDSLGELQQQKNEINRLNGIIIDPDSKANDESNNIQAILGQYAPNQPESQQKAPTQETAEKPKTEQQESADESNSEQLVE